MATSTKKGKQSESKEIKQTWNNITGVIRIYGNTFEYTKKGKKSSFVKWSLSVPGKDGDEYINYYVTVKFRGDDAHEPEEDGLHAIDVANAFFACDRYTNKDGEARDSLVLVVTDNEIID